jgi:hypothetical protein
LFLQSLSEEEQNPSTSNDPNNSKKSIEDKDLVASLETGVKFWTDYSKVQYHPQSLYELHGSWTDFDKFDNYGSGRAVVSEWSQMEEMNERLRFFVEECDHIQVSCFPQQIISKYFMLYCGLCSQAFIIFCRTSAVMAFCHTSVPYIDLSVIHYRESSLLWMIQEAFPV